MGRIIAIVIALILLYLLVVYIIIPFVLPVVGVLLLISSIIAAIYGLIKSIQGFGSSFMDNINPYGSYVDKSKKAPTGTRRSYFFGPGLFQVKETVVEAFENIVSNKGDLNDFKDILAVSYASEWYEKIFNGFVWIMYAVAIACLFVFGFVWTAVFSAILSSAVIIGMIGFFLFFSVLWLVDRGILWAKSIQSRCGRCKNYSVVPNFVCPACGMDHSRLTPGAYGIVSRKCSCGNKLPTTIFTGRSKLTAKCPQCATELAASDARQFGIQVVGGVSAGKTTFLAAFWHEYIAMLDSLGAMKYEKHPLEAFEQLEEWFTQGISSATTETNATMYSVVHELSEKSSVQLTLYDIAGESFADIGYEIQQQQFRYCEGFIFIVDPTTNPDVAGDVISSFTQTFKDLTGKHSNEISNIPVAVVVSKSDLFKKEIGLPKIKVLHKNNPHDYVDSEGQSSVDIARNTVCREFLETHDFNNVVNLLDGTFADVQYFPVSAIGHEAVFGTAYEPWGVLSPIEWILKKADAEFQAAIMKNKSDVT